MDESRRLQYISYGLYRIVNNIVGTERIIQIRRSVTNLSNDFNALYSTLVHDPEIEHQGGSFAEGFRFKSSDMDSMYVLRDIIVTDHRYTYNHSADTTLLIMETEQCRPGFALLRLLSSSRNDLLTQSCVQHSNGVYVSNTLWKQATPKVIPNGVVHGPCDSGILGDHEVDFAHCFRCDSWPESTHGFINRLRRAGWPNDTVTRNILKNGCHVVAIGGKGSAYEDIEWLISFAFAEKILIHNMNHDQFLCYGLLKIFLKEVLENRETGDELLCSYFLKTAVFWEICDDRTIWSSTTFLRCFWACFRRLISWVYNGYCPNFFIPENNMFCGKIQGRTQSELLNQLMALYSEGYNCLLRCPSLQPYLGIVINQPVLPDVTLRYRSDAELYSQSSHHICMIVHILYENPVLCSTTSRSRKMCSSLQSLSLLTGHSDEIQRLTLSIWERCATQYLVVLCSLEESSIYNVGNREMYHNVNSVLRKLRSQQFDLLNHHLLSAVYLYRCGLYHNAVKVLLHAKSKLQQPNVMYGWTLDEDKYRAGGGEHTPLITMMGKVVADTLDLPLDFCVPELTMEHQADVTTTKLLFFPPLVIINFLLYLSRFHMQQTAEANAVLQELATLLVSEEEQQHIRHIHRAISWTVLGICQEMSGELANAHKSYTEALNDPFSSFKDATKERIGNVITKINNE